jgi:hypothetical protein
MPSVMLKADPIAVELFAIVTAKGCPAAMEEFPKRPEAIVVFETSDSPSENT